MTLSSALFILLAGFTLGFCLALALDRSARRVPPRPAAPRSGVRGTHSVRAAHPASSVRVIRDTYAERYLDDCRRFGQAEADEMRR